jgi:CheY-like chemotaxis protein
MTSASVVPTLDASHGQVTILVVEDDIVTRVAISQEMRDHGCRIIEAGSADEALSVLRTNTHVDAVVTDLIMPGPRNGADLVRLIRAEFSWLKIIMLSGYSPDADVRSLLDGCISKPILPSELMGQLRALISTRAHVEVS